MSPVAMLSLLLLTEGATLEVSPRTTADIVVSVQQHSLSGCVLILHHPSAGLRDTTSLVQLQKLLHERETPVAVSPLSRLWSAPQKVLCSRNAPLFVVQDSHPALVREVLLEVSSRGRLTGPRWLLLLPASTDLAEFFTGINIPFDCEMVVGQSSQAGVTLTEVYRVHQDLPLRTSVYGAWTAEGATWAQGSLYQRRNDLKGLKLEAAYNPIDVNSGWKRVDDYVVHVWMVIQKHLNYTNHFATPPDNYWGHKQKNGSWNGMVGMVHRKEVDFATSYFTMSPSRLDAVDYTVPIIMTSDVVFIRRPVDIEYDWNNFLLPFSWRLWLVVVASIFLLSMTLTVLYHAGQHYANRRPHKHLTCSFLDSLFHVFGIFCQQGQDGISRSMTCRVVLLTSYATALVVLASYSGSMVSYLTQQRVLMPFTTLEELANNEKYRLIIVKNSGLINIYNESKDPTMQKLYKRFILPGYESLAIGILEGLQSVCNDTLAFQASYYNALNFIPEVACRIVDVPRAAIEDKTGFIATKGSPYLGIINHFLLILRDNGVMQRMRSRILPLPNTDDSHPYNDVTFQAVTPMFAILFGGVLVATLILVIECGVDRAKKNNASNIRPATRYMD